MNAARLFRGGPLREELKDGGLVVAGGQMVVGLQEICGLGVKELTVGIEDEQVGIALGLGIVAEEGLVFVVGIPVDVDYDVVLFEGRGEGRVFVERTVEQMAPGAPVASDIEEDVLVPGLGLGFGGGQVFGGVAGGIEDVFGGEGARGGQNQGNGHEAKADIPSHRFGSFGEFRLVYAIPLRLAALKEANKR